MPIEPKGCNSLSGLRIMCRGGFGPYLRLEYICYHYGRGIHFFRNGFSERSKRLVSRLERAGSSTQSLSSTPGSGDFHYRKFIDRNVFFSDRFFGERYPWISLI